MKRCIARKAPEEIVSSTFTCCPRASLLRPRLSAGWKYSLPDKPAVVLHSLQHGQTQQVAKCSAPLPDIVAALREAPTRFDPLIPSSIESAFHPGRRSAVFQKT